MDTGTIETDLREIVGERVTTSGFERWFYTGDFVPIPRWVTSFFTTMPAAVVKPRTVEEVGRLLRYCSNKNIPVVPRGAATSGLFGAVPKKGGVVLDLRGMSAVTEIDAAALGVTVHAGLTWWELDLRLKEEGLALKSYPSSARSATIGGWVMGSGLGIGSLPYGPVCDHLLSMEVVFADGTVRTFSREQGLDRLCETEGILGIVTTVSLAVRKAPASVSSDLVYFDDMKDLFDFVRALAAMGELPYALEISDHRYLSLVRQSGYDVTDFSPGGGTLLVTWDSAGKGLDAGTKRVQTLAARYRGEMRDGGEEEWNQRFNMLRIRRAVPTVLPVGVHVPLEGLDEFYAGLGRLGKRSVGLMGHVVSRDDCMVMSMLVTDKDDPLEFGFALTVPARIFALARSCGGRPAGGIGVWNAPYAREVFSPERVDEIGRLKKELDPKGILNPGMWSGAPLPFKPVIHGTAMKIAGLLDRIRPERPAMPSVDTGFGACVQCGYCMDSCPTRGEWVSSTPRGRILMTREVLEGSMQATPEYLRSVFACTLCGRCAVDCSVSIDSPGMWIDLRSDLVGKGRELDCLKAVAAVVNETHNTAGKPNDQRANWARRLRLRPDGERTGGKIIYFTGCVTSFFPMVQDIARSFVRIADEARFDVTLLGGQEWCCGYPLISAGHRDDAAAAMRHNIDAVKKTGAKTLVVTCPGCYRMWKDEYFHITGERPGVDVLHSTEFIMGLIRDNLISLSNIDRTVTYHDPCDLGRASGIYDEPRSILASIPGLRVNEQRDNREYCSCCGSGGDLLVSNQDLSLGIAKRKLDEVLATGAATVVTACPSCVRSLTMAKNANKMPIGVADITQLVLEAMVKTQGDRS